MLSFFTSSILIFLTFSILILLFLIYNLIKIFLIIITILLFAIFLSLLLLPDKLSIYTLRVFTKQCLMRANLFDFSLLHHYYLIRIFNR